MMKTSKIRTRTERGTALVWSVVFSMVAMAFSASVLTSGVALQQESRAFVASAEAQQCAESGVHFCVARMSGPNRGALLAAGGSLGVLTGTGDRAARFEVAVLPAGDDGADNDVDGLIDEEDEANMVEVVSTGSFDGVSRTVYVTLLARYRAPNMGSAAYIENPLAGVNLNGKALLISGHDVDLAGAQTGNTVPGVGVNGDPGFVLTQIKAKQGSKILGLGGAPSVQQVPPLDLQALIEEGARSANVELDEDGTYKPTDDEWGTIDQPAVVYANGSIHVSSGSQGAGLFIVNGDLTITGGFQWKGLVIVRGQITLKGGGDGKRIIGGLVVQDDLTSGDPLDGSNSELNMTGTVDIIFSEETVNRIGRVLSRYTILNWREGPRRNREMAP